MFFFVGGVYPGGQEGGADEGVERVGWTTMERVVSAEELYGKPAGSQKEAGVVEVVEVVEVPKERRWELEGAEMLPN